MKKIAFVLAVLLFAAPAWATVWIDANDLGGGQVAISYITDGNLPRAFGLDITVDAGTITACVPAMVGECNDVLQGYGIFPGTIQIDVGGNVTDDGDPYAPVGATGALGGIDTNGITLEMGSLYTGLNEPAASGLLCTITVTENCTVSIAGNAARCGTGSEAKGVVMEDPDEVPDVNYVGGPVIVDVGCTCFGDIGYLDPITWLDTYGQDGTVDFSDFNLFIVAFIAGGYNITTIPPELLCVDMAYLDPITWLDTWGTDGVIDFSDFNVFIVKFIDSGYSGPCLTGP